MEHSFHALFVAAAFVSSIGYRAKCVCPLVSHARQAHLIIQLFISIFAIDEDEKRLTAKQVNASAHLLSGLKQAKQHGQFVFAYRCLSISEGLSMAQSSILRTFSTGWSGMRKIRRAPVPKRTVQPSFFVMITCGGHHDNVSPQRKGRKIWQKQIRHRCLYV